MANANTFSAKRLGTSLFIATVCLIFATCLAVAFGKKLPGRPTEAEQPIAPDSVLEFAALYSTNCAACHGARGKLGPAPPLNDPLFRALVPLDNLEQIITVGRPGTPMPGFDRLHGGRLTAAQIKVLAFEIKGVAYKIVKPNVGQSGETKIAEDPTGIASTWGPVKPAPSGAPPYALAKSTSETTGTSAEAKQMALFKSACADCHGSHGEGADYGRINSPDFLALASDQMLRRIIITGRADLGMPDYAGADQRASDFKPLTSEDVDQLVALLGRWRHGSAVAAPTTKTVTQK